MARGAFPEDLTKGLIVLLPKKLDQRLLTNKRPITLLSVQNWSQGLTKAVDTNSPENHCPPNNSPFYRDAISIIPYYFWEKCCTTLRNQGGEYILIKFDVIKAFDRLAWPFLFIVLRKMGMEGLLTEFLKASCASATSVVLLNGLPTPSFVLKRSVRHGCPAPISPSLYNCF